MCMHLGCSVIKLMINDITSMWQTGYHGNTTLNKHYVPTGTERKRERGERERGKERECRREMDEMKKDGEERGGGGRCFSGNSL